MASKSAAPNLRYEKSFLDGGHRLIAGCDEVGRGALAGPVSVGIVVVDASEQRGLTKVRDSKLLTAAEREALVPRIQRWAVASAVGHASSVEIDTYGLMAALRLAGTRAWRTLLLAGTVPHAVILDGNHNWLSPKAQPSLFDLEPEFDLEAPMDQEPPIGALMPAFEALQPTLVGGPQSGGPSAVVGAGQAPAVSGAGRVPAVVGAGRAPAVLFEKAGPAANLVPALRPVPPSEGPDCEAPVFTKIKADMQCLSVAAASVLAKVERDAMLRELDVAHPEYGWAVNKGYATSSHRAAIVEHGPSPYHRMSWRLTG
jgi:ribonuclease HII